MNLLDIPHNVVYPFIRNKMNRKYISIYFKNGDTNRRKKRDITISFGPGDNLYERCKRMSSSEIRGIIKIETYKELIDKARKEDRTINNYIKSKLRNIVGDQ